jgi:hypothetical protein
MSLQELKNQAYQLSVIDRLELASAILESLKQELRPHQPLPEDSENPS